MGCLGSTGLLISGGTDALLFVWKDNEADAVFTLRGHSGAVTCLATVTNMVVSGSVDRTVRVWDVAATGQCLASLEGHTQAVSSVAANEGLGSLDIVSGSLDGTVRVWDVRAKPPCLAAISLGAPVTCIGTDSVRIVAGLRSGEVAVIGRGANVVLFRTQVHDKPVLDLALCLVKGAVATCSASGTFLTFLFPDAEQKASSSELACVPTSAAKKRSHRPLGSAPLKRSTAGIGIGKPSVVVVTPPATIPAHRESHAGGDSHLPGLSAGNLAEGAARAASPRMLSAPGHRAGSGYRSRSPSPLRTPAEDKDGKEISKQTAKGAGAGSSEDLKPARAPGSAGARIPRSPSHEVMGHLVDASSGSPSSSQTPTRPSFHGNHLALPPVSGSPVRAPSPRVAKGVLKPGHESPTPQTSGFPGSSPKEHASSFGSLQSSSQGSLTGAVVSPKPPSRPPSEGKPHPVLHHAHAPAAHAQPPHPPSLNSPTVLTPRPPSSGTPRRASLSRGGEEGTSPRPTSRGPSRTEFD